MRIRTIKPEFFKDERIADLSYPAAFHFPALWLLADRAGRIRDKPREIKAEIAPLREVDMEAVLAELAAAGLILRYTIGTDRYLQVCKLGRHQRFNSREPQSALPSPDSPVESEVAVLTHARTRTHVQDGEEGKGMEGNGREGRGSRRTRLPPDFAFTKERLDLAIRHKVPLPDHEFAKFTAHYQSSGGVKVDWDKSWLGWCLRAVDFNGRGGNGSQRFTGHSPVIPSVEETRRMMRAKGIV